MLVTINVENAINPEMVFIGVHPTELETLERAWMKHLFNRYQPGRQTLGVVVAQKRFERLAVGRNTVRPEIIAHQCTRFDHSFLDEGQRDFGR